MYSFLFPPPLNNTRKRSKISYLIPKKEDFHLELKQDTIEGTFIPYAPGLHSVCVQYSQNALKEGSFDFFVYTTPTPLSLSSIPCSIALNRQSILVGYEENKSLEIFDLSFSSNSLDSQLKVEAKNLWKRYQTFNFEGTVFMASETSSQMTILQNLISHREVSLRHPCGPILAGSQGDIFVCQGTRVILIDSAGSIRASSASLEQGKLVSISADPAGQRIYVLNQTQKKIHVLSNTLTPSRTISLKVMENIGLPVSLCWSGSLLVVAWEKGIQIYSASKDYLGMLALPEDCVLPLTAVSARDDGSFFLAHRAPSLYWYRS